MLIQASSSVKSITAITPADSRLEVLKAAIANATARGGDRIRLTLILAK